MSLYAVLSGSLGVIALIFGLGVFVGRICGMNTKND